MNRQGKSEKTTTEYCKPIYYAPNLEVEEAYWFGPVSPSVCPFVCYACTRSRADRDRFLKFGMWEEYEN